MCFLLYAILSPRSCPLVCLVSVVSLVSPVWLPSCLSQGHILVYVPLLPVLFCKVSCRGCVMFSFTRSVSLSLICSCRVSHLLFLSLLTSCVSPCSLSRPSSACELPRSMSFLRLWFVLFFLAPWHRSFLYFISPECASIKAKGKRSVFHALHLGSHSACHTATHDSGW